MHTPFKPDAPYLLLIVKEVIPKEEGMSEEARLYKAFNECGGLKKQIIKCERFEEGTHFIMTAKKQHIWKPAHIDELLELYTSYSRGNGVKAKQDKVAWVAAFKTTDDYKAIKEAAATEAKGV